MLERTRRHTPPLGVAAIAVLALHGDSGAAKSEPAAVISDTSKDQQTAKVSPATVTIAANGDERGVAPVDSVRVAATSGTLFDVSMINEQGKVVDGRMAPDRTAWTPAEPLGYGRTYTLSVTGQGSDMTTTRQVSRFSTVAPVNQTRVSLTSTSGAALTEGATYGVGLVIVARFDEDIPDRAAAERQLQVRTSPPVEGSWSWVNDRKAHWRPRAHFPPGTQVTTEARIYGVDLGGGLFGQEDSQVSFRIGPSHVTIADDLTKQVSVYENGRRVRTMPTSMGRGGSETVDGKTIHFWTQRGVYTVMDKANPVLMDSSTYGLPIDSPSGYRISVPYATRISPDGIYLHEREATVWAQGNTNVSAGCLNLSAEDAKWFFDFSQPGDVVEIRNTGGEPLQQWQNGDWSVPWEHWLLGSALRN